MVRIVEYAVLVAAGGIFTAACSDGELSDADESTKDPIGQVSQAATPSPKRYGMWCQPGDYEIYPVTGKPWLLATGTQNCASFDAQFKTSATKHFYYDLKGAAKSFWESGGDAGSMEQVDLAFADLHGGANTAAEADYGMWKDGWSDWNARVLTSSMRLGESSASHRGLSVLATKACDTLKPDGNLIARWDSVMRGGLRLVLGSPDNVWIEANGRPGDILAKKLKAGSSFRDSWYWSLESQTNLSDVAVMATGVNETDCFARLRGMKWSNLDDAALYPRLRDASIGYYCWETWYGI